VRGQSRTRERREEKRGRRERKKERIEEERGDAAPLYLNNKINHNVIIINAAIQGGPAQ
jgi:hypothetical protein